MKHVNFFSALVIIASLAAPSAFAAKYSSAPKAKNSSLQKLVSVLKSVQKDKKSFGDASFTAVYSFERGDGQSDLNVVKQLNHMKAGLNSDDSAGQSMQAISSQKLADFLFENAGPDDRSTVDDAIYEVEPALASVKASRSLQIYGTSHADEDGSWQILNILDTENDQVVLIRMGYSGT